MTLVRLTDVNVRIPIYDSHALRLIRLPAFGRAQVGTQAISHSGAVLIIHALNSLNLELHEGDRVCLIGHNGAGKTTLLRVLAGIYPTWTGKVEVVGKVFALLGNPMMMNPDATGYETIRLVANLYHWPQERMAEFIRDIEEFTELGEYLSLPTRVYSAGMQTRLAFAMATVQTPDILLIDEGIGAGDAHFQNKAQVRVRQFISRAKIIALASHSIELCRAMCTKALILNKGTQVFFGGIEEGLDRYAHLREGPA
jgi:ABC-2 type transport system ATP-binding protein/lipopolysaccharide transport system ATP-binding protein